MTTMTHPLLAAPDITEWIIPALVFVFWVIGQVTGGGKKPKPPVRPRVQPPVAPAGGQLPGAQPGKPVTLEETLRREVEEFMRRAQGREQANPQRGMPSGGLAQGQPQRQPPDRQRQGGAQQGRPQQGRPQQGRPQQGPQGQPPRRDQRQPGGERPPQREGGPRRLVDSPRPAQSAAKIESGRGPLIGASVAEHVAEHLSGVQAIAAHAQTLGSEVAQADERMQAHLQETFTHNLGSLGHQAAAVREAPKRSGASQDFLKLLGSAGGARQIIIAGEILRRPEERWARRQG
ncbi:MAG TPA: hypothetical protein VEQ85_05315 [Lacipirellulaceae bacterium]|nr:hypothetical protein [Lacipirellulaceae bacterium]